MANLGIPIVITSYLLIRFENTSDLIEAISELKMKYKKT
ncbi:YvrJ family protein [Paenibacillus sp. NPDC058910]